MDWVTTTTILQRLHADEDPRAWDTFVQRFRIPVIDYARRLGISADEAPDLAQEVLAEFVKLYRDGRYDRHRGRLNRWLFGIAHRYVLRYRRAHSRQLSSHGTSMPTGVPALELWNRQWDRIFLEECIERVRGECSPEAFRAFTLVVLEELSPAEAAEHLSVSVKRVYNDKHRVLNRIRALREELEGWAGP